MSTVVKDLGAVSAYAYAVEKGYTGTEAEFAELMADYAEVGQRAEDAADSALESKTAAQTAATTATTKASEATTAATTATTKAGEASTSASTATSAKDTAVSASQTATTKATEATTAAATATSAKTDAVAANTAAQSAKTAAQTAQTGAETAAASVQSSASQIAQNTSDISELKEDLSDVQDAVGIYNPPTASGTSPATSGNSIVLTPITLIRGHRYKYEITYETASDATSYLSMWMDGASSYFSVLTISAGSTTASKEFDNAVDTNSAYMAINTNARVLNYTVKITDLDISGTRIDALESDVADLKEVSAVNTDDVTTIDRLTVKQEIQKHTEDITDRLTFTVGAMNKDGSTTSSTSYYHTSRIPVHEGDVLFTQWETTYRVVTCFANGEVVLASGTDAGVTSFTVPDGIDEVVITIYADQNQHYGTINKTSYYDKQNILENRVANSEQINSHTFAKRHPMVTFIDDDGNVEFYTYLLPIMRTYGIPMVSAYMGDANEDMQSNTDMMNYEQCCEVVENGGELITHYRTDATTLTIENAEKMMLKSKAVLDKFGFSKASRLLAYSDGRSNTSVRDMASRHFDCAFSGAYPRVSATDRSNHDCIVQYAIHREPCGGLYYDSSAECATLPYFKAMIDECVAANGWLVFTMHSWLMPSGKQQEPHTGIDQFGLLEDIIEYIQELQTGGSNIEIVTASKGLETFGNAWQAGDYLGYWNEQTFNDLGTLSDHTQAGVAVNKLGQYDFPSSNAITHS